jgi:hypothetical protein
MYADPSLIRDNVVKIRLNDPEAELIDAWVRYTGQQKAALLRETILSQIAEAGFPSSTTETSGR